MPEFYVSFEFLGMNYVAYVIAPELPENLRFANYEEFHAALDALGHAWIVQCETPHPREYARDDTGVWEKQLAEVKVVQLARPIVRLPGGIVTFETRRLADSLKSRIARRHQALAPGFAGGSIRVDHSHVGRHRHQRIPWQSQGLVHSARWPKTSVASRTEF